MQIIDFERKGNVVRFYLGKYTEEYGWLTPAGYEECAKSVNADKYLESAKAQFWGDDWDDRPYEHNAGGVYDRYVYGYRDVAFGFDDVVVEPSSGCMNSDYSKEDMITRRVPCIVVVPGSYLKENSLCDWEVDTYECAVGIKHAQRFYFGDELGDELE